MKPRSSRRLLICGLALTIGCGARTPLEDRAAQGGQETGGSWGGGGPGPGGSPGSGGKKGSGGSVGYGGSVSYGGSVGYGGGHGGIIMDGGRPGGGGTVSSGGRAGSGGSAGGQGGYRSGGASGSGGSGGSGGRPGSGGSGGSGGRPGSGGSGGSGGSKGTGGSGGGGAGGTAPCSGVTPCGGDVVGTWTVTSSCLTASGPLDLSLAGLVCPTGTVTAGTLYVTGTWTAKADGTYVDDTLTTGKEQLTLPPSCLLIAGTTVTCSQIAVVLTSLGYDSISCGDATGGGCTCWATVNQRGWPGTPTLDVMTKGKYKTAGNVLSLDDEADYAYCVSGNKMTWTPQGLRGTKTAITGTIAFESSTPGSGGAGGRGGAGGSGGAGGTSACPPLSSNEELIDDLNDGDRYIMSVNGRVGAWNDAHDDSPNAKMYPDSSSFVPSQTGDTCRKYAVYVSGGGYVLWGANFWFGLGSPYDASKYTGISFWAKVDAGASPKIRVAFPDKDTHPDGALCTQNPSSGPTACLDHYGSAVLLTTEWQKYQVSFAGLAQEGWGRPGKAFDPSTLYQVMFQIPVGASFGIWIDDVALTF